MTKDLVHVSKELHGKYSTQIKSLGYSMIAGYSLQDRTLDITITPPVEGGTIEDAVLDQIKDMFPEEIEIDFSGQMRMVPVRVIYEPNPIVLQ